jgi:hypothetical protein
MEKNQNEDEILYDDFEEETKIDELYNIIDIEHLKKKNDFVKTDDMKKFVEKLTTKIKQQVVLDV